MPKKKVTIYIDENIISMIDAISKKDASITRSSFINDIAVRYFKESLNSDKNNHFCNTSYQNKIDAIYEMAHVIIRDTQYLKHLINGGIPVFNTNTDTKIIKPTNNLRNEASKKMVSNIAKVLRGEIIKEDYYNDVD